MPYLDEQGNEIDDTQYLDDTGNPRGQDPEFADVESGGSAGRTAPLDRNRSYIGAGPKLAPEPSSPAEALDRVLERLGLGGTGRNPTSRTLAEEPLNESDAAGVIRGGVAAAATAAAPFGMGAVAGLAPVLGGAAAAPMSAPVVAGSAGAGYLGSKYGGEGGRALGEKVGLPETGEALGETAGALAGGVAGAKTGKKVSEIGSAYKDALVAGGIKEKLAAVVPDKVKAAARVVETVARPSRAANLERAKRTTIEAGEEQAAREVLAKADAAEMRSKARPFLQEEKAHSAAKPADKAFNEMQARLERIKAAKAQKAAATDARAQMDARKAGESRAADLEADLEAGRAEAGARASAIDGSPEGPARPSFEERLRQRGLATKGEPAPQPEPPAESGADFGPDYVAEVLKAGRRAQGKTPPKPGINVVTQGDAQVVNYFDDAGNLVASGQVKGGKITDIAKATRRFSPEELERLPAGAREEASKAAAEVRTKLHELGGQSDPAHRSADATRAETRFQEKVRLSREGRTPLDKVEPGSAAAASVTRRAPVVPRAAEAELETVIARAKAGNLNGARAALKALNNKHKLKLDLAELSKAYAAASKK